MDRRDYGVAIGNGKRAAGAEIILHVDDEKDILRSDLYRGHALVPILCSLWPVERTGGTCADRHAGQDSTRRFQKFPLSVKMASIA